MKKNRSNTFIGVFSIFFFTVCIAEGILYYNNRIDNVLLSIALNIQNAVKAFMMDSEIKIDDAVALIDGTDFNYFKEILTYLYVVTIVLAPFCTVAVLFKLIKKPIYFMEGFFKSRKDGHILICGDGENKDSFIDSISESCRVLVYEKQIISEEKSLKYLRNGITYFTNMGQGIKQNKMLKKVKLHHVDYILLCDDDPLVNLDYLRIITEFFNQFPPKSTEQVCYIQCQEYGMREVIQKYYDSLDNKHFDLNLVDIKQKAVNKMFMDYKLYEFNKTNDSRDVHLAIIGFGDYGQNTLIQTLNNGVFSNNSTICIDVFDNNIDNILGVFLKKFSSDILDSLKENVPVGDVYANYVIKLPVSANQSFNMDGEVILRFWSVDVSTIQFTKIINGCIRDNTFTYVVIAINEKTLIAATLLEIQKILHSEVPIIVRTAGQEQAFEFLNSVNDFKNVHLINKTKDIYSMDALRNVDIVNMAKSFHKKYIELESNNSRKAEEWIKIPVFKRESSIAQAMHQEVKEWILGNDQIIDEHGALEHRRWSLFMISNGYKYSDGNKNDKAKTNPCICTWEVLSQNRPDMLKYDFTPYEIIKAEET